MKRALLQMLLVLAATSVSTAASAQAIPKETAYPTRPIRFVVPFPPGGTTDIQARRMADHLRQRLGQPIVIDNRSGANGTIGMRIVAQAPADGYTIIMANVGNWAVHPHLYKLDYDVLSDFAPIIHVATNPGVLLVNPSLPVKTVQDLVALARQKPGELTYGSGGVGGFTHLSGVLFASMTKIRLTHVPYKGSAPAIIDLIAGHVQMAFSTLLQPLPHIKAGRLRALAATGTTRLHALPELPTIAEAGVSGFESSSWSAIAAPARTARPLIDRLNKELAATLQMPDIQETARVEGSTVTGGTPQQFQDILKSELAKFGKLIKEAGITLAPGG